MDHHHMSYVILIYTHKNCLCTISSALPTNPPRGFSYNVSQIPIFSLITRYLNPILSSPFSPQNSTSLPPSLSLLLSSKKKKIRQHFL